MEGEIPDGIFFSSVKVHMGGAKVSSHKWQFEPREAFIPSERIGLVRPIHVAQRPGLAEIVVFCFFVVTGDGINVVQFGTDFLIRWPAQQ